MNEVISVKNASENNLKSLSVEIPRDKMVIITGLSGSGKSSLAFDTIYAEGQRRFVESLSSFARQFLGRMSKPNVESITGIPPAISIEQKVNTRNPRSTVGTITEIYDYLRLLYTRIGKTISPISGEIVKKEDINDVVSFVETLKNGELVYILSPFGWEQPKKRVEKLLLFKESGFSRIFVDGKSEKIDAALQGSFDSSSNVFLLIDRIIKESSEEFFARLMDSVNTAFSIDRGDGISGNLILAYGDEGKNLKKFTNLFEADGLTFMEPEELLFSYNNPLGACQVCGGYGKIIGIDESLVIPNKHLTIFEEAVACWKGDTMSYFYKELINNAHKFNFPIHKPYSSLTEEQKELLWKGNSYFTGIDDFFKMVEATKYKIQYRYLLSRYSGKRECPECKGSRLRKEALYVQVGGASIDKLMDMSISSLINFFDNLQLNEFEKKVTQRVLTEIRSRLSYLNDVGLSYLTLNRASNTLSGGESQRINLVSSIGSNLTGSLYILDEPSIGLHPRDTERLIYVLKQLRDLGNSLIIVEHDEEIMRSGDYLLDIGPRAGRDGGELVFKGSLSNSVSEEEIDKSLTLQYLYKKRSIAIPTSRREWSSAIEIKGAYQNNLKNLYVKFPLKVLTVVTGVSGSGKSTLVKEILYPAMFRQINQFGDKPGSFKELAGDYAKIKSVEFVDQNPIGRSSRSNPATYLKIYDEIRKLFSEQPYAKQNGYGHSHFSFNIDGGRCPECHGEGVINIEMQFMADVQMVCESCGGKRFKQDILEVKYKEKSINDVLNMTVLEAIEFFSQQKESIAKRVADKLQPLADVGLSYVQLGQSSSTLSGGESQRVKLASFLSKESQGDSILFIFDEPTTGLHFHDIKKLLDSFNALLSKGHTIIVIEHNIEVIKSADWVIDLGPEGGDKGGELIFEGTPEDLSQCKESYTAKALKL